MKDIDTTAFDRVLEWITMVVKWVMVSMTCVIFFITTVTVFMRYVLNIVPSWSEEIPRYLLVWITYLGAALAIEEIARGSASLAVTVSVTNSVCAGPIVRFGTEDQRRRYLPPRHGGTPGGACSSRTGRPVHCL